MADKLEALGESAERNKDRYNFDGPDGGVLETFEAPKTQCASGQNGLIVRASAEEVTHLCPITGQPDFATITIEYLPAKLAVESKSLKLYLMGYRNYGTFHEAMTQRICDDLVKVLDPMSLRVTGVFKPRGGIGFTAEAVYSKDVYSQDKG